MIGFYQMKSRLFTENIMGVLDSALVSILYSL